jgi:multiple sugar transport system permease protein/raffinose/stachyose/melibiose transport system permease protein
MSSSEQLLAKSGRAGTLPAPASPLRGRTADDTSAGQTALSARARHRLTSVAMVGPALATIVLFVLVPIVVAGYLSLTDWDGFSTPTFVGLHNYSRMLDDPGVQNAASNTAIIAGIGTVLCNGLGLGLAMLLNGTGRGKALLRGLLFYPYIIGAVIIGFLWSAILGPSGAVNSVLTGLGLQPLPFLSDPHWALGSLVFVVVWSIFGVNVVLYLAGLQAIPDSLLEAARVDGATAWQTFRKVYLPMLAPSITVNTVLVLVQLLRVYDQVLALTDGGPAGTTETVAFRILSTSFRRYDLGYGSAQSIALMFVIGLLAVAITMLRSRSEKAVQL